MKKIAILGSAGSIGTQTLELVRLSKENGHEEIEVVSLAAKQSVDLLFAQVMEFAPKLVCVYDADKALELERRLRAAGSHTEVVSGMDGLISVRLLRTQNSL